ncbi:DUF4140 domain-containing protein, partial [Mangrovactinospora gilvigrisea]|uniref:DUF4140 domain-containing protein n=1 Tax=Mangrovactinospora gilvigrisea TaxID=1428644 RepID=UPI0011149B56
MEVVAAESRLVAVTVHAVGAECRRAVRVEVPAGAEAVRVRVPGLPRTVDPAALRAGVTAPGVTVTDVRLSLGAELGPSEQLPELVHAVERAERELAEAEARRERLTLRVAETAALRAVTPRGKRGDSPRPAPVEARLALAAFVDARLESLHAALERARQDADDARHAVALARARRDEATT